MPPKPEPAHPKYDVMIKAAITALKERTGSSTPAIAKYLVATYKLPENYKKMLGTQLKKLAAAGKLVRVKASFKLSEEFKKKFTLPQRVRWTAGGTLRLAAGVVDPAALGTWCYPLTDPCPLGY